MCFVLERSFEIFNELLIDVVFEIFPESPISFFFINL